MIWFLIVLCVFVPLSNANEKKEFFNERVERSYRAVSLYNQKQDIVLSGTLAKYEVNDNAVIFTDELPLKVPIDSPRDPDKTKQIFSVTTFFLRQSPTIEKRVHIQLGPEEVSRMRFVYRLPRKNSRLAQYTYQNDAEAWQIYESPTDIFFYAQRQIEGLQVEVKEWIYAEKPNSRRGSVYEWDLLTEEFNRFLELDENKDGSVSLQRHTMVGGVNAKDKKEQKRVVGVVREAMKKIPIYIHGEDIVGTIEPVRYWTREGVAKMGMMRVSQGTHLTVQVREPESAYPLVIDPCIILRQ